MQKRVRTLGIFAALLALGVIVLIYSDIDSVKWLVRGRCISFGGVGPLGYGNYIIVHSDCNELTVGGGSTRKRWQGESWKVPQVVAIWRGSVYDYNALPAGFQLGESVMVAFTSEDIRFTGPGLTGSGYYDRWIPGPEDDWLDFSAR